MLELLLWLHNDHNNKNNNDNDKYVYDENHVFEDKYLMSYIIYIMYIIYVIAMDLHAKQYKQ